jgi:hypothetical protein
LPLQLLAQIATTFIFLVPLRVIGDLPDTPEVLMEKILIMIQAVTLVTFNGTTAITEFQFQDMF